MTTLRRRMHVLERAHSDLTGSSSPSHIEETDTATEEHSLEYETPSDSSESVPPSPHSSAPAELPNPSPAPSKQRRAPPPATESRPWYLPSLAVACALVPPVGNLLTGGDEIRNLIFMVLLMWYLHQIVEGASESSLLQTIPTSSRSAVDAVPKIACCTLYSR